MSDPPRDPRLLLREAVNAYGNEWYVETFRKFETSTSAEDGVRLLEELLWPIYGNQQEEVEAAIHALIAEKRETTV